jgi:hypothetical protein
MNVVELRQALMLYGASSGINRIGHSREAMISRLIDLRAKAKQTLEGDPTPEENLRRLFSGVRDSLADYKAATGEIIRQLQEENAAMKKEIGSRLADEYRNNKFPAPKGDVRAEDGMKI